MNTLFTPPGKGFGGGSRGTGNLGVGQNSVDWFAGDSAFGAMHRWDGTTRWCSYDGKNWFSAE